MTITPRPARAALLDQLAKLRAAHPTAVEAFEARAARALGLEPPAAAAWRAEELDDAGLRDFIAAVAARAPIP